MYQRDYTMGKLRIILILLMVTVLTAASDFCEAAAPVTISQVGASSTYSITTVDLPEAAGMDLVVKYDPLYLESPQVKTGNLVPSGALMVPNVATAGYIRIAIVTGGVIKGTGELISISFTAKNKPAPLPTLSSSVYSALGSQLAVDSSSPFAQPSNVASNTNGSKTAPSGNSGTVSAGTSTVSSSATTASQSTVQTTSMPGSVLLPQESGAAGTGAVSRDDSRWEIARADAGTGYAAATPSVDSKNRPAASMEAVVMSAVPATQSKAASSTLQSRQSVLDRFRTYKDVRSLKQFSALFDVSSLRAAGIVQSPAMVVSDGKSRVTISIDLGKATDAPSFSLKGANQKSLRRMSDNKWELEALPQKGKSDVRLSILLKGEHIEIPLVVIPPLGQAYTREFDAFTATTLDAQLAKPLKNNKPAYDLNSDKKQDYIDDYILVGHWLLKQQPGLKGVVTKPAALRK